MKKTNTDTQQREDKKAIVLNQAGTRRKPLVIALLVLLVGGSVAAAYSIWAKNTPSDLRTGLATPVSQNVAADHVSHPVNLFDDGKARHFDYRAPGVTVRYFVIKSADGVLRAAFDACDVCWRAGKGYYQEGDAMVCRNCGRRFASNLVNEVQGGCNPAPLARTVKGDQLIIRTDDILKGQQYFNI